MNQQLKLNEYKQQIAELYSRRSHTYDDGDWHPRIAHRLVELAHISRGQHMLDIATGTGMVAIEAARIVGSEGRVIGVDISDGMLDQARRKVETLGLSNVEFQLADAEALNFSNNSFDLVLCSSALIWMTDIPAALRLWYRLLVISTTTELGTGSIHIRGRRSDGVEIVAIVDTEGKTYYETWD